MRKVYGAGLVSDAEEPSAQGRGHPGCHVPGRLSRNKSHIKTELEYIQKHHIRVKVLDIPITLIELPEEQDWIIYQKSSSMQLRGMSNDICSPTTDPIAANAAGISSRAQHTRMASRFLLHREDRTKQISPMTSKTSSLVP